MSTKDILVTQAMLTGYTQNDREYVGPRVVQGSRVRIVSDGTNTERLGTVDNLSVMVSTIEGLAFVDYVRVQFKSGSEVYVNKICWDEAEGSSSPTRMYLIVPEENVEDDTNRYTVINTMTRSVMLINATRSSVETLLTGPSCSSEAADGNIMVYNQAHGVQPQVETTIKF